MADLVTSAGASGTSTTVTSASTDPDPSGSNRYVLGVAIGFVADPTAFDYAGAGGSGSLSQVGSDATLGGVFTANAWEVVPGPNGDTAISGTFSLGLANSLSAAFYDDVDQEAPAEALQTASGDNGGFAASAVATITVTGVESGQEVPVGLAIGIQGGVTITSVVAGANTTVVRDPSTVTSGENQASTTLLRGVASGSTLTLSATITVNTTFGNIYWWLAARPLNDAAGGSAVFNPLTGRGGAAAQPLAA